MDESKAKTADPAWNGLYKVGGGAALMVVVLAVREIIVFAFYPQHSTVIG